VVQYQQYRQQLQAVSKTPAFKFFQNPLVQLAATLFISWALRPKVPDTPDFATNSFDEFEKGILLNKQSNDANIPVIYGERLVGGTRVFVESSGTDNQYLIYRFSIIRGRDKFY
jgi:hypothetical protein